MRNICFILAVLLIITVAGCSDDDTVQEAGVVWSAADQVYHLYSGGYGTGGKPFCNTVYSNTTPVLRGAAARDIFYLSASAQISPRVELSVSGMPETGTNYQLNGSATMRVVLVDGSGNSYLLDSGELFYQQVGGVGSYCSGEFSGTVLLLSGTNSLSTNYVSGRFKLYRIESNSWGLFD